MSNSNGIISAPVDIRGDIAQVLGVNSGDLAAIVTSGDINPWAMFKPVRDSSERMVNRPEISAVASVATLGFGTSAGANTPPTANTIQKLLNLYADSESLASVPANGWRYLRPRGKAYSEPFRVYDFARVINMALVAGNGYDGGARNPFGSFVITRTLICHLGGHFSCRNNPLPIPVAGVEDTRIVISTFNAGLGNTSKMLYYGCLLVLPNSAGFKVIGNVNDRIDDNVQVRGGETLLLEDVTLNATNWPVGTYTAYPFLTTAAFAAHVISKTYTQRNDNLGITMYPLPGSVPASFDVFANYIDFTVHASPAVLLDNQYSTEIYYTIKNNYDTAITITNLMLKWRSSAGYSAARQSGETFYSKAFRWDDGSPAGAADGTYAGFLADITIASGEEVRIPVGSLGLAANIPNINAVSLFIGCTYNSIDQYGTTTVIIPINPS